MLLLSFLALPLQNPFLALICVLFFCCLVATFVSHTVASLILMPIITSIGVSLEIPEEMVLGSAFASKLFRYENEFWPIIPLLSSFSSDGSPVFFFPQREFPIDCGRLSETLLICPRFSEIRNVTYWNIDSTHSNVRISLNLYRTDRKDLGQLGKRMISYT